MHLPPGLFCLRNIIRGKIGLREIWGAPETWGSLAQMVSLAQPGPAWPRRAHALTLGVARLGSRSPFSRQGCRRSEAGDGLAHSARTGQGLSGTKASDPRDRMSKKAAQPDRFSSFSLSCHLPLRRCWGGGREVSFQNLCCLGLETTGVLSGLPGGARPFLCRPIQLLTDFFGLRGYSSKYSTHS